MATASRRKEIVGALSLLALNPNDCAPAVRFVAELNPEERKILLDLADGHHVVLRALEPVRNGAEAMGDKALAGWAREIIDAEHKRIDNALHHLDLICKELEAAGCAITVMKSLDHWPDLGNDLDLFTPCPPQKFSQILQSKFDATMNHRTWGDHLANKWNFSFLGLREAVEIHSKRLGQTGEHIALASRFHTRRVPRELNGSRFYVPAPEERVIAATLQRMYRHFFFRICDVINTAELIRTNQLDYVELRKAADVGGVWPGVATFLRLVSEYAVLYGHSPIELPAEVLSAARFGVDKVEVKGRGFVRIPLASEAGKLYVLQLGRTALRGNFVSALRLSLLPPLASAAALRYAITGDDQGIW